MFCSTISFGGQWFSILSAHHNHLACFNKNTDVWVPKKKTQKETRPDLTMACKIDLGRFLNFGERRKGFVRIRFRRLYEVVFSCGHE